MGLSLFSKERIPMTQQSHPPTQPPECLIQSRSSRYKGGTIIAEDVWTIEVHLQRLCNPDGYRPGECRRCGESCLHVHDYLQRKPVGLEMVPVIRIVRYICAACCATWRVLPAFLPRHLWSVWRHVEAATDAPDSSGSPATAARTSSPASPAQGPVVKGSERPVPSSTLRRWLSRLEASARQLVVLFASRGTDAVCSVSRAVGADATRRMLADAYAVVFDVTPGLRLGAVGTLTDRLERGIRLM
jgi:hypothetical protein